MKKKKIALIIDTEGWAFDNIAKQIKKNLTEYIIEHKNIFLIVLKIGLCGLTMFTYLKYHFNKENGNVIETKTINEVHSMRYFFRPELELLLNEAGFELVNNLDCNTLEKTDFNSWTSYFIARAQSVNRYEENSVNVKFTAADGDEKEWVLEFVETSEGYFFSTKD